jgi:hypothetical protein
MSPSPTSPRKEGGQPGNQNALKHGFYAIQPEVLTRLDQDMKGELWDEIDALRSLVDATLATFNRHDQPTLEQCQTTLRGVSQAFDTMKGLYLMRKVLYSKQTTMEQILEELADIPFDQD